MYVKVLGIGRQRVNLGIEAPKDVKIVRDELRSPQDGPTSEGERLDSKGDAHLAGSFRPARRRN
ncbi:MAG: carbon storage regulator [Chloroflexi bacterium]|nr:carbon storage regulator [Chloroflexota bacterium]